LGAWGPQAEHWDYRDKIAYNQDEDNQVRLAENRPSQATTWCQLPGQLLHPQVPAWNRLWVVQEREGFFAT